MHQRKRMISRRKLCFRDLHTLWPGSLQKRFIIQISFCDKNSREVSYARLGSFLSRNSLEHCFLQLLSVKFERNHAIFLSDRKTLLLSKIKSDRPQSSSNRAQKRYTFFCCSKSSSLLLKKKRFRHQRQYFK